MQNKILNREGLARAVRRITGIPITRSLEIVNSIFDAIAKEVQNGNEVKFKNFGSFTLKARIARFTKPSDIDYHSNPELYLKQVIKFKAAANLKSKLQSYLHMIRPR